MINKFCRRCGQPLTKRAEGYVCQNGHAIYDSAIPAGGVLLLNDKNEVLIATRALEPGKGTYSLPGGFCDIQETHLQAAIRELQEETGLAPGDYTDLQYLVEAIDQYEYQGELKPAIGVCFWARMMLNKPLHPSDDVASLQWMPLASVDFTKTDPRLSLVRVAITAMREKLRPTV